MKRLITISRLLVVPNQEEGGGGGAAMDTSSRRRALAILGHLHPMESVVGLREPCSMHPSPTSGRGAGEGSGPQHSVGKKQIDSAACSDEVRKENMRKKAVLVIGAGDATGGAVARRFAREGFVACVVRRHAEALQELVNQIRDDGGEAVAFGVDARKEEEVVALVEKIEAVVGDIHVAVFNIGANVNFSILDTSARVYFKVWEMACFSGFLMGREVAKHMVRREQGTIIFTGATASLRGGKGYAAFAGAKFGLRALAQSMGRELGPKGIHVAHVIIDAAILTSWTLETVKGAAELNSQEGMVIPADIAETYWQLHLQPKTAWSHELDVRPWIETW